MRQLAVFLILAGLVWLYAKYEFGPNRALYGKVTTFDGRCFYSPASVPAILAELAPFKDTYIRQERTIDLVFPMLYGGMFAAAIMSLAGPARMPWWLTLIPVIAAAADYVENLTTSTMMSRYPAAPGALAWIASVASGTKGVFLLASLGATVVLVVMAVVRR